MSRYFVDVTFEVEANDERSAEQIVQEVVDNAPAPAPVLSTTVFEPYALEEVH